MSDADSIVRREWTLAAFALLLIAPALTVGVLFSFVIAPGAVGNAIYMAGKVWVALLPAAWWVWVDRRKVSLSPVKRGGLWTGAVSGVVIAAGIYGAWWWFGQGMIDATELEHLRAMMAARHLDNVWLYLLLAVYIVTLNSLIEEYVFRWFVFVKLERVLGGVSARWRGGLAILGAAVVFTAHHVLVLRLQFDWGITLIGSAGVFAGGVIWSWLYLRYRSIWPCWVSHAIVDVPIFVIGWELMHG